MVSPLLVLLLALAFFGAGFALKARSSASSVKSAAMARDTKAGQGETVWPGGALFAQGNHTPAGLPGTSELRAR